MNRLSCGAAVFIFVFMAASCKSAPAAGNEAQGADDGSSDVELLAIYSNYDGSTLGGITLDGAKEYTVKYGDTLTKIAREYYGEDGGYYFPLIIFASRTVIVDPDKILPGQILIIPDLRKNLDNPISRLQIKSMLLDIAFVYDGKADETRGALKARNQTDRNGLIELSRSL
jgi:LysM repeat protein